MDDEQEPNVIPLDRPQKRRAASDAMVRARRRKRERDFAALELEVRKRPRMTEEADRVRVAQNLFGILKRFEKDTGERKVKVVRASNIGGDNKTESTKRLDFYALDPEKQTSPNRIARLVKSHANYTKLARKAAELARWDSQEILLELFEESSYLPKEGAPEVYGKHLDALQYLIDGMGEMLRRKTRVEWYFWTLRKQPVFDEWGNFLVKFHTNWPSFALMKPEDDLWLWLNMSIPSVPLYRMLMDEWPVDFVSNECPPEDERYDGVPPKSAMVERLHLRRYREIRLGMAPRTWSDTPEMVFDERLICEFWDDEGWRGWIPYGNRIIAYDLGLGADRQWAAWEYSGWPLAAVDVYPDMRAAGHAYGDRRCWIREGEGRVARRLSGETAEFPQRWLDEGFKNLGSLGLPIEQFVEPVSLNSCAHYLGEPLNETVTTAFARASADTVYESPPNTIAAALEVEFYANMDEADETAAVEGDKESTLRVELRLKQEIDRRCALLERCLAERDALVQRQRRAVLSRWGLDGEAP